MGSVYSTVDFGFKANAAYPERRLHFSQPDRKRDRDGHDDAHDRVNNMTANDDNVQNLSLRKHMQ